MKYLLIFPFYLMANEAKKLEWFPTESKLESLYKIPCEDNFQEMNPWEIRPWENGAFKKNEFIKGPRETKTCKFFSLKF